LRERIGEESMSKRMEGKSEEGMRERIGEDSMSKRNGGEKERKV
jgi:hypothetical protein